MNDEESSPLTITDGSPSSTSTASTDPVALSQNISDTQDTSDSYITSAQRPKTKQNQRPTPFYLTNTYSQVVNGSLWDIPDRQESEELPLDCQLFPEHTTKKKQGQLLLIKTLPKQATLQRQVLSQTLQQVYLTSF